MKPTPEDLKGLQEVAAQLDNHETQGLVGYLRKTEKRIETVEQALKEVTGGNQSIVETVTRNVLKDLRGEPGKTPEKGVDYVDGKTPEKGVDYFDGEDYVLTDEDLATIASMVEVPIVEKVIERIETVHEQPIHHTSVTEKEVAIFDAQMFEAELPKMGFAVRDALETLIGEDRLDAKYIKNLPVGSTGNVTAIGTRFLYSLLDVSIITPTNGQALLYNSTTKQWYNGTIAAGVTVQDIDGSPLVTNVTAIKFTNGAVTDNGDGTVNVTTGSGGGGDVSSNTATSVDSEIALFSGTGGKTIKRASATGIAKLTSGVLSAVTAPSGAIVGDTDVQTLTNKTLTAPVMTTPTLGVASATTINKVTVTAPATGSTLTIDDGFTLRVTGNVTALSGSHSGTSSGTNTGDQTSVTGNAGTATALQTARAIYGNNFDGTAALTQIIASGFGGTGNGFTKFSGPTTTEKTFTLPDASSTIVVQGGALGTPSSGTLTNATGLPIAGLVASTSTALGVGSIELGHASDTTLTRSGAGQLAVEGVDVLTTSNTKILTNKSISASQITTGTFGTGAYTMDTSLTIPQIFDTVNTVTASANAITITRANRDNKVTNNSAAGLTITLSTTSAVDGDKIMVSSFAFSAVAQTITWVNTENSDVTPSANLNASTTLPRTDGFRFNGATSKWRCIASC